MAAAALKLGEQKGEKMGLPCEKDTDDKPAQINHEGEGATQDSGEVLDSLESQKMESEMQMAAKHCYINCYNSIIKILL